MRHAADVTTPSDREVQVTRLFDAPRELIFDCHTRPELVRRWLLGPDGWSMPVCEIDLRVGGSYRYVWRNDADGREFGMGGVYQEIAGPERIVHTERFEDDESVCTLTLVEEGGRTRMTQTMRFASQAVRDAAMATGMTDGMATSFDRLEDLLAETQHA